MVRIGLAGLPWLIRWYTNKLGWVVVIRWFTNKLGWVVVIRWFTNKLGWVVVIRWFTNKLGPCFGFDSLVHEYIT